MSIPTMESESGNETVSNDLNAMVLIEINIGKDKKDAIVVHFGDDLHVLAENFVKKHGLDSDKLPYIISTLENTIDKIRVSNLEIRPQSPSLEETDIDSRFFEKEDTVEEDSQPPVELPTGGTPAVALESDNGALTIKDLSSENFISSDIGNFGNSVEEYPDFMSLQNPSSSDTPLRSSSPSTVDGSVRDSFENNSEISLTPTLVTPYIDLPSGDDKKIHINYYEEVGGQRSRAHRSSTFCSGDLVSTESRKKTNLSINSHRSINEMVDSSFRFSEKRELSSPHSSKTNRFSLPLSHSNLFSVDENNEAVSPFSSSTDKSNFVQDTQENTFSASSLSSHSFDNITKYGSRSNEMDWNGDDDRNIRTSNSSTSLSDDELQENVSVGESMYNRVRDCYLAPTSHPKKAKPQGKNENSMDTFKLTTSVLSVNKTKKAMDKKLFKTTANERLYMSASITADKNRKIKSAELEEEMKQLKEQQYKVTGKSKHIVKNIRSRNDGLDAGTRLYLEGKRDLELKTKLVERHNKALEKLDSWSCSKCGTFHNVSKYIVSQSTTHIHANSNVNDVDIKLPTRICSSCGWNQDSIKEFQPASIAFELGSDVDIEVWKSRGNEDTSNVFDSLYEQSKQNGSKIAKLKSNWEIKDEETTFKPVIPKGSLNIIKKKKMLVKKEAEELKNQVDESQMTHTEEDELAQSLSKLTSGMNDSFMLQNSKEVNKYIKKDIQVSQYFNKPAHERLFEINRSIVEEDLPHNFTASDNSFQAPKRSEKEVQDFVSRLYGEFEELELKRKKELNKMMSFDPRTGKRLFTPTIPSLPKSYNKSVRRTSNDKKDIFVTLLEKGMEQRRLDDQRSRQALERQLQESRLHYPKALAQSESILRNSSENSIQEMFRCLLAIEVLMSRRLEWFLELNDEQRNLAIMETNRSLLNWKTMYLNILNVNIEAMSPETRPLLWNIQREFERRYAIERDQSTQLELSPESIMGDDSKFDSQIDQEIGIIDEEILEEDEDEDKSNHENQLTHDSVDISMIPSMEESEMDHHSSTNARGTSSHQSQPQPPLPPPPPPTIEASNALATDMFLLSYPEFRQLVYECLRKKNGPGKSYFVIPRRTSGAVIQMLQEQSREYTYRPRIDRISEEICSNRRYRDNVTLDEALYNEHKSIQQKIDHLRATREREEQEELTFQPKLIPPPKHVVTNYRDSGSSSLYNRPPPPPLSSSVSFSAVEKSSSLTFQPKLYPPPKSVVIDPKKRSVFASATSGPSPSTTPSNQHHHSNSSNSSSNNNNNNNSVYNNGGGENQYPGRSTFPSSPGGKSIASLTLNTNHSHRSSNANFPSTNGIGSHGPQSRLGKASPPPPPPPPLPCETIHHAFRR